MRFIGENSYQLRLKHSSKFLPIKSPPKGSGNALPHTHTHEFLVVETHTHEFFVVEQHAYVHTVLCYSSVIVVVAKRLCAL